MEEKTYYVSIRFELTNKSYTFKTEDNTLKIGDLVIVETQRGLELGEVTTELRDDSGLDANIEVKPVLHRASKEEIEQYNNNKIDAKKAMVICQKESDKLGLDMNVISAEYTLDRFKVTFTYLADDRVDFRELLKVLASIFHCRIDLRQIGARDKSKMVSGIGVCGRELCCSKFITEFDRISINMAKNQLLALNVSKLSGHCGSLMCCLKYEDEAYKELRKDLPKMNSQVEYEDELYRITSMNVIARNCKLENKEKALYISLDELMKNGKFKKTEKPKSKENEKTE